MYAWNLRKLENIFDLVFSCSIQVKYEKSSGKTSWYMCPDLRVMEEDQVWLNKIKWWVTKVDICNAKQAWVPKEHE